MNKQFAVFGVGKFGESVAVELQRLGCEVIAVDKDMERVEHIADSVSYAMQADFGDPDLSIHSEPVIWTVWSLRNRSIWKQVLWQLLSVRKLVFRML